jgi:carbamoyl-phosphate synthase large subunit
MGGQTALNLARQLARQGILDKYGVRLIGASLEAIEKAEDRQLFKEAMERIGLSLPKSGLATSLAEAKKLAEEVGFPAILRPSFTLAGTGGGIARNMEELEALADFGLRASPVGSILVEESVLGWKEYELEVVRDPNDNVIIVCSIENLDPMGVHTGDSITVAPAQTLTDKEYQRLRNASIAIIREIGVDTGGSNVQFGINPKDGRLVVIEMNPRVSRSSALASKATGYPIAKVAAKLALGYTLDELKNDITRDTPASFEPTLDYVVVKIPRFNFEKFHGANPTLGTTMRSVGEAMAIGRTFTEAYLKALRSLELGRLPLPLTGVAWSPAVMTARARAEVLDAAAIPTPERPFQVFEALQRGATVEELFARTAIDPWFLSRMKGVVERAEDFQRAGALAKVTDPALLAAKADGFSDALIAALLGCSEAEVRERRWAKKMRPVFKRVDTCAAEFEAYTPYLYSTYGEEDEAPPTTRQKILILGSGPIRIGQGIEFDYCCVHAAFALRDAGFETLMLNCNPETVSTDYDTSDRLYFEPLTFEDVLEVVQREKPIGVIVQFGGQTPLKLSTRLEAAGVPILGTTPDAIDRAEDRERFAELVDKLKIRQPENGVARSPDEALEVARRIGYPVMVRPSYVLGGRAMEVVHDDDDLRRYTKEAVRASSEHPVLIDRFLQDAVEVDLDLVADRTGRTVIGGVMEHVEQAGVHSGDAACTLPPHSLASETIERMKDIAAALAKELGVVGLMNVQFAVQGKAVYVLEVNPRASRTVPFVSKATGVPLARVAALCMAGKTLAEQGVTEEIRPRHISVKESVFPFARFSNTDVTLGPEMKSTGEVMGLADTVEVAFGKSQTAAGTVLPSKGLVFISVTDNHKPAVVDLAQRLLAMGFTVCATGGTHDYLRGKDIACQRVKKISEGGPHIGDAIAQGTVAMLVNTTGSKRGITDGYQLRREALLRNVPYFTTVEAARMAVGAMEAAAAGAATYRPLQDYLRSP